MNGTNKRRFETLALVVRIESLKDKKERDLDIESIIARAEKFNKYVTKL